MGFGYAIYFSERAANRVTRWDPDTKKVDVLVGDPRETDPDQKLHEPYGLAFDWSGSLLIADKGHNRICRLRQGRLETLALRDATGHRGLRPDSCRGFVPSILRAPTSLVLEQGGTILATFYHDHTIYRIHRDLKLELILGMVMNRCYSHEGLRSEVPSSLIPDHPVNCPTGVVARSDGTVFFIERGYEVVREYDPKVGLRTLLRSWRSEGKSHLTVSPDSQGLESYLPFVPTAIALDREENLYLCDTREGSIMKVDLAGRTVNRVLGPSFLTSSPSKLQPSGVTFGPDGTAWVADAGSRSIQAYAAGRGHTWKKLKPRLEKIGNTTLGIVSGGLGLLTGK